MQKPLTFLSAAAFAITLALPVAAQDTPTADTVLATVNGTEITLGHVIVAHTNLPEQYSSLPDEVLFQGLLDQLIQQTALSDTVGDTPPRRIALALENETRALRAGGVINQIMETDVSDEALQAAYDAQYNAVEAESEYNASHILVETEEEANAVIALLNAGSEFAAVAREKSTGPSGPGGGSLGWFGPGMMVPSFEQAVVAMEVGAVSAPVQTQFGWHVIKLNEKRLTEAPSLESVREELTLQIQQTAAQQQIEDVTNAADVDRSVAENIDPSLIKNHALLD